MLMTITIVLVFNLLDTSQINSSKNIVLNKIQTRRYFHISAFSKQLYQMVNLIDFWLYEQIYLQKLILYKSMHSLTLSFFLLPLSQFYKTIHYIVLLLL